MASLSVKEFVTAGNFVTFDSFRAGIFYYNISHRISLERYQFQVPIEDIGGSTLLNRDKSVTFMRWIRKSIDSGTMVKIK
jgi:hypothetical protein